MNLDDSYAPPPAVPSQAEDLEVIREGMLALPPTGPDGFEGLIAALLTAICGRPFRLAKSGSQGGRDGDDGSVYFEAKRYRDSPNRQTVADKLLELLLSEDDHIELFVLAATCEIGTQHRDFYAKACHKMGVELLLLDWSTLGTPALCVLLTLAPDTAHHFFETRRPDMADAIHKVLSTQTSQPGTQALGATMRARLISPLASLSSAIDSARRWFASIFSSISLARRYFHQPLAPHAPGIFPYRNRVALSDQLGEALSATPTDAFWLLQGIEGAGKSWLMAATWSALERPPLLVFVLPEECRDLSLLSNLDEFIARKLAAQSTQTTLGDVCERWRRRIRLWNESLPPVRPRLVVYLDGINQVPDVKWCRWIESLTPYLAAIGGRLVVSSRPDFAQQLLEGIGIDYRLINVPVWRAPELWEILKERAIDAGSLPSTVSEALRNPRLLSIALEVLDSNEIRGLEEFNVTRLLFEYMRKAQSEGAVPLSPSHFKAGLQSLAKEFVERIKRNELDDLHVYKADFDAHLTAAAESRFFKAVPREPGHYSIDKDGLSLSLGLWLIQELEREVRNGRDPGAKLATILEPISALDETAETLLAATMVAFLDTQISPGIIPLLLVRYSVSQNRSHENEPMLQGLTLRHVNYVLDGAELAINEGYSPDDGLIGTLLMRARTDTQAWGAMSSRIREWLVKRCDTIDPVGASDEENRRKRIDERRAAYTTRLETLSPSEQAILVNANAICLSRDVKPYHKLAFLLLRGQALSPFSNEMVAWSLGTSIWESYYDLHNEFLMLVRHNTVDWAESQAHLATACAPLTQSDISVTGKWAMVRLLHATGAIEDAEKADLIFATLTKDREQEKGWSWRQQLCANDPCDPETLIPDNLSVTVEQWRAVPPETLFSTLGHGQDGLFFIAAELGIIRFMPDLALERYRALLEDVVTRRELALMQGIQQLRVSSALLKAEQLPALANLIVSCTARQGSKIGGGRDTACIVHSAIEAILPHLDGAAQLDLFERMHTVEITRFTVEMLKPIDKETISGALFRAVEEDNAVKLANVLCLFAYSDTPIGTVFPTVCGQLLNHRDSLVRAHALATVARVKCPELVQTVVHSSWSARSLGEGKQLEIRAGSRVLAIACEQGHVQPYAALERMSTSLYGLIARCSDAGVQAVCNALNGTLRRVLEVCHSPVLAVIEEEQGTDDDIVQRLMVFRFASSARVSSEKTIDDIEQPNGDANQPSAWQSYLDLDRILTAEDAQLALHHVSQECVELVVTRHPEVIADWLKLIERAGDVQRRFIMHFWQQLVVGCSHVHNDVEPLRRLSPHAPLTNVVSHYRGPKWFSSMLWRDCHLPAIRHRCFHQLDVASSDAAIATEVFAAENTGNSDVLDIYLDEQLAVGEPLNLCRALMVAGFRDRSPRAEQLLAQFSTAGGMVEEAWNAARYAFLRNQWSHHWFNKMKEATSGEDFWIASKLFLKLTDIRYRHWLCAKDIGQPFIQYFPTIQAEINHRLDRWEKLRLDKLYGEKLPWWSEA